MPPGSSFERKNAASATRPDEADEKLEIALEKLRLAFWPQAMHTVEDKSHPFCCQTAREQSSRGKEAPPLSKSNPLDAPFTPSHTAQQNGNIPGAQKTKPVQSTARGQFLLKDIKRKDPRPWRTLPKSLKNGTTTRAQNSPYSKRSSSESKTAHRGLSAKSIKKAPILVNGLNRSKVNMLLSESRFHEKAKTVLGFEQYTTICKPDRSISSERTSKSLDFELHSGAATETIEEYQEPNSEQENPEEGPSELTEFLDQVEDSMEPSKRTSGLVKEIKREIALRERAEEESMQDLKKNLRDEIEETFRKPVSQWRQVARNEWDELQAITGTQVSASRYWSRNQEGPEQHRPLFKTPRKPQNEYSHKSIKQRPRTARSFRSSVESFHSEEFQRTPKPPIPTQAHCRKGRSNNTETTQMDSTKDVEDTSDLSNRSSPRPRRITPRPTSAHPKLQSKKQDSPQSYASDRKYPLSAVKERKLDESFDEDEDEDVLNCLRVKQKSMSASYRLDSQTRKLMQGNSEDDTLKASMDQIISNGDFKGAFNLLRESGIEKKSPPVSPRSPTFRKPSEECLSLSSRDIVAQLRELRKEYEKATHTTVRGNI